MKHVKVKEIYLYNNDISDGGVPYIAKFVKANQTVCVLRLDENPITNKGFLFLMKSLQYNSKIEYLWLTNTHMNISQIEWSKVTDYCTTSSLTNQRIVIHLGNKYNITPTTKKVIGRCYFVIY